MFASVQEQANQNEDAHSDAGSIDSDQAFTVERNRRCDLKFGCFVLPSKVGVVSPNTRTSNHRSCVPFAL